MEQENIFFLPNGEHVFLHEQVGGKYIVSKVYVGDEGDYISPDKILVDTIYAEPPVERVNKMVSKLNTELKEIQSKITSAQRELEHILYRIQEAKKTEISLDKFVINKTDLINAKTIAFFPADKTMPVTLASTDVSFRGIKVGLEISVLPDGENSWGYRLYFDSGYSGGEFLCKTAGILINPTQEDIDKAIFMRLSKIKFPDYQIARTPDKYLNDILLDVKHKYLSNKVEADIQNLRKVILDSESKISELINKANTNN